MSHAVAGASTSTALPHAMSAQDVLREHDADEARVLAEGHARTLPDPARAATMSFVDAINAVRNMDVCADCGKTRVLLNAAGWRTRFREERPNPAIHCACPGGPAYAGVGGTMAADQLPIIGIAVRAKKPLFYSESNRLRTIETDTLGAIVAITPSRIVTVRFNGHDRHYEIAAASLRTSVALIEEARD